MKSAFVEASQIDKITYRDQKIFDIVIIRFRNNSAYGQRQIDRIFRTK